MAAPDSVARHPAQSLRQFSEALLVAAGLPGERARDVAEVLLEADLLGHTTHGLALLPAYLAALEKNTMEKDGEPAVVSDQGSALTWDGNYLPGPWLVRQAVAAARARLAAHPVVTVVIRRSHHIGCLAAYLKPVTDAGLVILLSCSDPASHTVAPHGGVTPRISPNPLAAGLPTPGDPILIDISMSSTANGLCARLAAAGERLPGDWVMDRAGNPTDDPGVLFEGRGGSILPLGGTDLGYKGFALALLVEALTAGLGGHGRADDVQRWGASVFLQIIDPARFGGREAFARQMGFMAASCATSAAIPGQPAPRLPGAGALARRAEQLAEGVRLYPTILPALKPWAEKLGVAGV